MSDTSHGPRWWKRPVPLWAVVLIGLFALGLGAATGGGTQLRTTENGDT